MAERRGRGESAVYFEHRRGTGHKPTGPASDPENKLYHRGCTGVWRGEVVINNAAGVRVVRKRVNAATKTELYRRLKELKDELAQGVSSSATYTVRAACDDWLESMTDPQQRRPVDSGDYLPRRDRLVVADQRARVLRGPGPHARGASQVRHQARRHGRGRLSAALRIDVLTVIRSQPGASFHRDRNSLSSNSGGSKDDQGSPRRSSSAGEGIGRCSCR
jgi:hypothetical protein